MRVTYLVFLLLFLFATKRVLAGEPRPEVLVQAAPASQIRGPALSGDGKYVVTGGDGTVILWDRASGKKLRTYQTRGFVSGVAISDDGSRIVAGSGKEVVLWDAATGKQLQTFAGHKNFVRGITISGDGKLIMAGGQFGLVILWTSDGQTLRTFQAHTLAVARTMVSGDGSLLLTVGEDYKAIVWDMKSGKQIQTFSPKGFAGDHAALSHDGKHVVTAGFLGKGSQVILWDALSGKQLQSFVVESPHVSGVSISSDGKLVVTGLRDGKVILWDSASGKRLHTLQVHDGWVGSVPLTRDGKHFYNVTVGKVTRWETASGKPVSHFPAFTLAQVKTVHLSADGKRLLVGSEDKTAVLWDLDGGKPARKFSAADDIWPAALSGDGSVVAVGDGASVTFWDGNSGDKLRTLATPARLNGLAISNDGKYVVTTSQEQTAALLWEVDSGKKVQTFQGDDKRLYAATISGDGKQVATCSEDRTAILWDAASGKKLHTFPRSGVYAYEYLAFTNDGKHLAASAANQWAAWDTVSGKRQGLAGLSFRSIATMRDDRKQKIVLRGVALSADGKKFWVSRGDGSAQLWDLDKDQDLCRLYSFGAGKEWLAITPDGHFDGSEGGQRLVTFRTPGTLKVIDDEAARRRLYRPGLLAKRWKGETP